MTTLDQASIILKLAALLRKNGSWAGETHIQKSAYFLQELLGVPTSWQFILYKHGPYSFDLTEALNFMEAQDFIRWEPKPFPYGPSISTGARGEQLRDEFPSMPKRYAKQIEFVAQKLGPKGVSDLERISTALYATLEGWPEQDRAERIIELKPHVTPQEARQAVNELDSIRNNALVNQLIVRRFN
jgi:uncharacterized protein YwgA